jgi:transposase
MRAHALTEVHPPTLEEEAVRDLSRCREDVREDLLRARHRLGKMLLRRGLVHAGKAWTQAHRVWLRTLGFEHDADWAVFDGYLRAIEHMEERLRGLEEKLVALSEKDPYREPVGWLRCFRGIDTVTAYLTHLMVPIDGLTLLSRVLLRLPVRRKSNDGVD